ncbi:unnamed protein product [Ilex paraguariensis]|uniref:HNH domain-containing protein n=1 Tax=Ilex paraguariensis TaxID=185542 RepID=A0ABC8RSW8_9AQUA
MSHTSPPRSPEHHRGSGYRNDKEERPRFFDSKAKSRCWAKAEVVPGRNPERWRKDAAGNIVCKRFGNCQGCLCFEYDHIVPFSKGGESVEENCQILQTRVNRFKSAHDQFDKTLLKGYSCDVKFTGMSHVVSAFSHSGVILKKRQIFGIGTILKRSSHGTWHD